MAVRNTSQIRILAVDGGGIHGVLPAYWLNEFQKKFKEKCPCGELTDVFDWFAGTSTGSIIAAGLLCGKSTQEILNLYLKRSSEIFATFWSGMRFVNPVRWSGAIYPKYSDKGLNRVLKDVFRDRKLGEFRGTGKRLFIVTFNASTHQPLVFDSEDERYEKVLIWEACRASAAAPTYLPEYEMSIGGGQKMAFLDGGVAANDPAMIAAAKALNLRLESETTLVVSLGAGCCGEGFSPERSMKFSGSLPWVANGLIPTLMDGGNGVFHTIATDILGTDENYYRFHLPLFNASAAMDDASNLQINNLCADAEKNWNDKLMKKRVLQLREKLDCGQLPDLTKFPPVPANELETPSPTPAGIDFRGKWKSVYNWDLNSKVPEVEDEIDVEVVGKAFLRGTTTAIAKFPGQFEASFINRKIVGQWYDTGKTMASMFVLDNIQNDLLEGKWIGGNENLVGHWSFVRNNQKPSWVTEAP